MKHWSWVIHFLTTGNHCIGQIWVTNTDEISFKNIWPHFSLYALGREEMRRSLMHINFRTVSRHVLDALLPNPTERRPLKQLCRWNMAIQLHSLRRRRIRGYSRAVHTRLQSCTHYYTWRLSQLEFPSIFHLKWKSALSHLEERAVRLASDLLFAVTWSSSLQCPHSTVCWH